MESGKSLFEYNSKPPMAKVLPISLQHIMAMFVGTVTVPIVVAGWISRTFLLTIIKSAVMIYSDQWFVKGGTACQETNIRKKL